MRAELGDPAALDDGHPVGVLGGVQPVRHGHDGPAVEHRGQGAFQAPGRPRIEQRGGLIEYERVRVGQDDPGQGQLLGLCRGERRPAGPHLGVQPPGQRPRPGRGVHCGQRPPQGRVVGVRAGQPQVLRQGADEDVVLLGEQHDMPAQLVQVEIDQRHPADRGGPRPRRMDAGEQPAEGRLAGPTGPDHRQPLPGHEVELDPVQHVVAGPVGVAQVTGRDHLGRGPGAGAPPVVGDEVDADDPGQGGSAGLEMVQPGQHVVERVDELDDVQRRGGHLAHPDVTRGGQHPAPAEHRGQREHVAQLGERIPHGAQRQGVTLGRPDLAQVLVHPVAAVRGQPERRHRPRRVHRLGDGAVQRRVGGHLPQVAVPGPGQVPAGGPPQERHGDQDGRGDRWRGEYQGGESEDHRGERDQDVGDGVAHRVAHRLDVVRRAGHQVSGAGPLHGGQRQPGHGDEEALPQPGEHRLGEHSGGPVRRPGQPDPGEQRDEQHSGEDVDRTGVAVPQHLVDEPSEQRRSGQPGDGGEGVQGEGSAQRRRVLAQQRSRRPGRPPRVGHRERARGHQTRPRATVPR